MGNRKTKRMRAAIARMLVKTSEYEIKRVEEHNLHDYYWNKLFTELVGIGLTYEEADSILTATVRDYHRTEVNDHE